MNVLEYYDVRSSEPGSYFFVHEHVHVHEGPKEQLWDLH